MRQQIISEEDFDCLPPAGASPSPSIDLGSHLPNPLSPSLNMKAISAAQKISDSDRNITLPPRVSTPQRTEVALVGATVRGDVVSSPAKRDQINNVRQKEDAMSFSGVTRRKTYDVIARLLEAKRWAEVTDKSGNVKYEYVDDLEKQRQGAEMALRVMGDMIEHKTVEYGIADSTLEKLKAMSVADLRSRAAGLLAGRVKAVDVAVGSGRVVEAEVVSCGD